MDEPTTGLDPQARHLVWDRLKALLTEGRTIVLTTHFMDEAQRLCNRVAIMDHGSIITESEPRTLIDREIEAVVIEVYGEGIEAWFEAHGKPLSDRAELAGDTAFCYLNDPDPLMKTLEGQPELRALRRSANLEDVFLKLTGRDLRD
jgi:lipooligosaccharide transport system ATP-binding protein